MLELFCAVEQLTRMNIGIPVRQEVGIASCRVDAYLQIPDISIRQPQSSGVTCCSSCAARMRSMSDTEGGRSTAARGITDEDSGGLVPRRA